MRSFSLALAAASLLATPVAAQSISEAVDQAVAAEQGTPAEEASDIVAREKAPAPTSISTESQKIIRERMVARNADIAPLLARKRTLQAQFDGLLTPENYDEAKLAATMAEMRANEGAIVEKMGTSMLGILKALPEGDRALFFKTLTKAPPSIAPRPVQGPAVVEPGEGR